ncbi:MAG: hypothetical protein WB752_10940 [Pseudolabrys sp.]
MLLKASSIQHVASFGTSRKFGQGAVLDSTRKLHEAAEDKEVSRYQELRNNPIGNVGHLVPNFVALHVCKINNADMFVCDVGEGPCGSKVGAIAVLCGILRRVSQF